MGATTIDIRRLQPNFGASLSRRLVSVGGNPATHHEGDLTGRTDTSETRAGFQLPDTEQYLGVPSKIDDPRIQY